MDRKPVVLMILDGWGDREPTADNAVTLANPENFYALRSQWPDAELEASGNAVGLPAGQMGNSEVGHLNIGAGRVVYQEITRITRSIETGEMQKNLEIAAAMEHAQQKHSALHFLGLLSDGGVHSHITHLMALLDMAKAKGLTQVYVHPFLDGRDVPPQSALQYVQQLEKFMQQLGVGKIATLGGRFYGMDRDKRWERIEMAYRAMTEGAGRQAHSAREAIETSYAEGVTDEFILPTVLVDEKQQPIATIQDHDSVIFFNFRADRARQISHALVDEKFEGFARKKIEDLHYLCMTQYDVALDAPVAYRPQSMKNILSEVLANHGKKQLRVAETEKYAHLTFFFNGQVEAPYPGEERILIPSPKVKTYDLQPEMSAEEITQAVLKAVASDEYDVIMINFANPDMVGHTGVLPAAVQAVKKVDGCLGRIAQAVLAKKGALLVTADHGNCECMVDPETGAPHTAHTTALVPFILAAPGLEKAVLRQGGALEDIAPTLLELLGVEKPEEMTGSSLIVAEEN